MNSRRGLRGWMQGDGVESGLIPVPLGTKKKYLYVLLQAQGQLDPELYSFET